MVRIVVNGQPQEIGQPYRLTQLLDQMGLCVSQLAVELNRNVVPRSQIPTTSLQDGDTLEIVTFVGGG